MWGDREDPDIGLGEGSSRRSTLQEALDQAGLVELLLPTQTELDSDPCSAVLEATSCSILNTIVYKMGSGPSCNYDSISNVVTTSQNGF